jgi:hypothetical protein
MLAVFLAMKRAIIAIPVLKNDTIPTRKTNE